MPQLPSGTVTFVFSDIEGSTRLLKTLGDERYADLLRTHRRLVRETFGEHGGQEIDTQGDAFFYSFSRARKAVAGAVALQRAHAEQEWPGGATVLLRLGLHTGEPAVGEDGYTGLDVVRASRIAASGRGGQVLLSEATRAIVATDLPEGVRLRSLGRRRLKDIEQPEPLSELVISGLPESPAGRTAALAPPPTDTQPPPASDAVPHPIGLEPTATIGNWVRGATERLLPVSNRLIEERVLAQIEQAFEEHPPAGRRRQPRSTTRPSPTSARTSLADEIAKLQGLREQGALSDEQYARAVERAIERDGSGPD